VLANSGQLKEAEEILRDCVKTVPNDLRSVLGLTAVLIQRADQPDALSEAVQLIAQAIHLIHPDSPPELVRNLWASGAIVYGLNGESEKGRELLRKILSAEAETLQLEKIRDAFGL